MTLANIAGIHEGANSMKSIVKAVALAVILNGVSLAQASEPAPALIYHPYPGEELDAEQSANIDAFLSGLSPQQGEIEIKKAKATLNVSSAYYFLDAVDARSVLEEGWGNPPDETVLGMIFPAGASPLDSSAWGATINYSDDGYVTDKDANEIDYSEMMEDLQKSQIDVNEWRTENEYEPVEIIGWAESPAYNPETHKLFWAKELKFGAAEQNTLNYDIRVLGRNGALVIGFVASINQLAEIRQATPAVLEMAQFDLGSTYAEYQPGIDKKAAYGIAGLIGGAAIAKKTGLIAALLIFGKKFIVIIIASLAAMVGAAKRFLTGGR